jgi:BRO family, N-terminal domain
LETGEAVHIANMEQCMTRTALVFQNTHFDATDRNGQPWLRSPQIAEALGYSQANRVADTYNRHADEFTASMTALVKLPTAGGEQETRIFSLRGCHLLAMLSRTKIAKAFRAWVLDILDKETGPSDETLKPPDGSCECRCRCGSASSVRATIRRIGRIQHNPANCNVISDQTAREICRAKSVR